VSGVRDREIRSARAALRGEDAGREHSSVVIAPVKPVPVTAWPAGWEDVEVVDSVLVEEPPAAARAIRPADDVRVYDRTGRVPAFRRFGRIVSLLA
jgi:hypothetical protein